MAFLVLYFPIMEIKEVRPVIRKYLNNARAGWESAQDQGFSEFTGFPEDVKRRFNTSVCFSTTSHEELANRLLGPIKVKGVELDMDFALAGRDFPVHSTILELRANEQLSGKQEEDLSIAVSMLPEIQKLEGLYINYDYLFIDKGGNIILAASAIPEQVLAARQALAIVGQVKGLEPLPLTDILHISIARPTQLPKTQDYAEYYRLRGLRPSFHRQPLKMRVAQVNGQNAWDMLHGSL
ncbi:MAG: hypothetical protein UZ21_OP11001000328 [Microgenomates bacterium OLB22]|nr:MAG: hypothetical protein UZ21_OP11001000328 [Microgenomates bacterium OLB22]